MRAGSLDGGIGSPFIGGFCLEIVLSALLFSPTGTLVVTAAATVALWAQQALLHIDIGSSRLWIQTAFIVGVGGLTFHVRKRWSVVPPPPPAPAGFDRHDRLEIVGVSPAMVQVRQLVALASRTDANVLITGETGTGKELVARVIHRSSGLARAPFVVHSCAMASADSFESEFFGHRNGAPGKTQRDRVGLLTEADGGVLFLDELECLSLANQAKLLRVLDDGAIRPVGSARTQAISVRFFAATNQSPAALLAKGELRSDLYYRLRGFEVQLPPLRDRLEDLPLLAQLFLRPREKTLSARVTQALLGYSWPGNIRQLRSVLRNASAASSGATVDLQDLDLEAFGVRPQGDVAVPAKELSLETAEREVIEKALAAHRGNQSRAAAALGIHRSTLRRRLRQLGLQGPR